MTSLMDCYLRDRDSINTHAYEPEPGFFTQRMNGYHEDVMLTLNQEPLATLSVTTHERIALILSVYADLKASADVLKEEMDNARLEIFTHLDREGVDKVLVDSIPLAIVRSNTSSLDKVAFVKLGGSLKILEEAMVSKPKKAFLKITLGKDE